MQFLASTASTPIILTAIASFLVFTQKFDKKLFNLFYSVFWAHNSNEALNAIISQNIVQNIFQKQCTESWNEIKTLWKPNIQVASFEQNLSIKILNGRVW